MSRLPYISGKSENIMAYQSIWQNISANQSTEKVVGNGGSFSRLVKNITGDGTITAILCRYKIYGRIVYKLFIKKCSANTPVFLPYIEGHVINSILNRLQTPRGGYRRKNRPWRFLSLRVIIVPTGRKSGSN